MQKFVGLLLLGLLLAGCTTTKPSDPRASKLTITPDDALVGRVVQVNEIARFAVLTFPVGRMPARDQRMGVYRRGLKVGEVKISGPQIDENTAGDIINGEVKVGDELRAN